MCAISDSRSRNEAVRLLLMIITTRRNFHYYEPRLDPPRMRTERKGSNMAIDSVPEKVAPTDVGFKRELGLIGATWASETSIIGSGWLFAPLTAALLIG